MRNDCKEYKWELFFLPNKPTLKLARYFGPGREEIYDESAIRLNLAGYLSDSSRARFGGDNFCTNEMFMRGVHHWIEGLSLLVLSGEDTWKG